MQVSVEGCKFVQLKPNVKPNTLKTNNVSVEGCKFVQLKRGTRYTEILRSHLFQLKDVSLYN